MTEDDHLEAAYEDANGNTHGVGSPEYEEDYHPDWPDDSEAQFDDDPNPYHGDYSEE